MQTIENPNPIFTAPTPVLPPPPPPKMVVYTNYTTARLTCTPPEQKSIPGTGPQANPPSVLQTYNVIPLLYNYSETDRPDLGTFEIEGPELTASYGINTNKTVKGAGEGAFTKEDHSLMVRFEQSNQEQMNLLDKFTEIHQGATLILDNFKEQVGLPEFMKDRPTASGFKTMHAKPRDKMTKKIIEGKPTVMYFKLFSRGKGINADRTLFTDAAGTPIPWTVLVNVEMKFIPNFRIKNIYIGGGKASIQMEMASAIVTDIVARGVTTHQTATLNKLQTARPDLTDKVAAQIAKIQTDRQGALAGASTEPLPAGADQPTFSGITSGRAPVALPAPSAMPQALPQAQPNMMDYTANVPQRPAMQPIQQYPAPTMQPIQQYPAPAMQPVQQYPAPGIPSVPGMTQGANGMFKLQ